MRNQHTIILSALLFGACFSARSQSLTPIVMSTGGSYAQGGGNTLSYTVGEPFITYLNAGNAAVSQGFQHAEVSGVLPVRLLSFTAIRSNPEVVALHWETSSEQNNSGFNIERRLENETEFSIICFTLSRALNGISNLPMQYDHNDANNFNGRSYYRLKQIDLDGRAVYSSIKTINDLQGSSVTISLFPNPAKGMFHIRVTGVINPVTAELSTIQGVVVNQWQIHNQTTLAVSNFPAGTYILNIKNGYAPGVDYREKIVILP